ncbi:hypothetical protein K501DRAFT_278991 [Backusella circina FSU 941]|nr:hypothetical protein K501DRAFT_278991 [Backusella circina FSU 941]
MENEIELLKEENKLLRARLGELENKMDMVMGELVLLKKSSFLNKKRTYKDIVGDRNGEIVKYIQNLVDKKIQDNPNYWDFTKQFNEPPNTERLVEADMVAAKTFVIRMSRVDMNDVDGVKIVERAFYTKFRTIVSSWHVAKARTQNPTSKTSQPSFLDVDATAPVHTMSVPLFVCREIWSFTTKRDVSFSKFILLRLFQIKVIVIRFLMIYPLSFENDESKTSHYILECATLDMNPENAYINSNRSLSQSYSLYITTLDLRAKRLRENRSSKSRLRDN